jgi:hypothetical protein
LRAVGQRHVGASAFVEDASPSLAFRAATELRHDFFDVTTINHQ